MGGKLVIFVVKGCHSTKGHGSVWSEDNYVLIEDFKNCFFEFFCTYNIHPSFPTYTIPLQGSLILVQAVFCAPHMLLVASVG